MASMIYSSQVHSTGTGKEREYLEGWRRALAELDNFRKRVAADDSQRQMQYRRYVVESLLQVADSFRAVVEHVPSDVHGHDWTQGVLHVARQFNQLLQEYGVAPIDRLNIAFDPTIHEAVEQVKKKGEKKGMVVEILQPGYAMGDTIIRPAKVKVAA